MSSLAGEIFGEKLVFDVLHLLVCVFRGLEELGLLTVFRDHRFDLAELLSHPLDVVDHVGDFVNVVTNAKLHLERRFDALLSAGAVWINKDLKRLFE